MNEPNLYADATKLAQDGNQVVGEKNDYYITLQQLMDLIARNLH